MVSPRWGHQAAYVDGRQEMWIVGGEIAAAGTQVTNEVLVLSLNGTNPSFKTASNNGLPPHAFASLAVAPDASSLVVVGGMTSSCGSDSLAHTYDLSAGSTGQWHHADPSGLTRRRGAEAAWINNGNSAGALMLVGGISDSYVCAASTTTYSSADTLSMPIGTSSLVSTKTLPSSLTGTNLAVADFAMTTDASGKLYLGSGQTSGGTLVDLSKLGVWTNTTGWTTQTTTGDIPAGRVGASLVAHPNMDLLVLHGGSTPVSGGSVQESPSTLLAFLNTTTWEWSTPHNLQPPASSAVSYHTSIMTPSGVMITAFGLGASGSPRSDVYYLDMRDPSQSTWSWKSQWSSSMLAAYTAPGATGATAAGDASDKKKTISIAVPVVIIGLLMLPLMVWFVRRRVRINRKRRMAKHFSFETQEDEGDFARRRSSVGALGKLFGGRKTKTQYSFGRDANEKDGNLFTDMGSGIVGILKRAAGRPRSSLDGGASGHGKRSSKASKLNEKHIRWEEIDFGLGRLDERRASAVSHDSDSSFSASSHAPSYGGVASTVPMEGGMGGINYDLPMHQPLIHFDGATGMGHTESGTPKNDGQHPLVLPVPSLVVMAPTTPHTPSSTYTAPAPFAANPFEEHAIPTQDITGAAPTLSSVDPFASPEDAKAKEGLDWSLLAQELEARPAFRSISPTSTLRSHAHDSSPSALPYTGADSTVSRLLPTTPTLGQSQPTITLVNPRTGRRTSEILPFPSALPSSNTAGAGLRSVSSPLTGAGGTRFPSPSPSSYPAPAPGSGMIVPGRQLAGHMPLGYGARRDSLPNAASPPKSPRSPSLTSARSGGVGPRRESLGAEHAVAMRRSSSASLNLTHQGHMQPSPKPEGRRSSQLRVVNVTDDNEASEPGQAL